MGDGLLVPDLQGLLVIGAVCGASWAVSRLLFRVPLKQAALEAIFVGYLVAVSYVTVFAYWYPGRDDPSSTWWMVNLVPLRTIIELAHPQHMVQAMRQLVGNVVLFVPFGFLTPMLSARLRPVGRLTLAAVVASVSIELLQLVLRLAGVMSRSVDVDDVILNTLGAVVGWGLWNSLAGLLSPSRSQVADGNAQNPGR